MDLGCGVLISQLGGLRKNNIVPCGKVVACSSAHQYLHMHDCLRKHKFSNRDLGDKFTVNRFHLVPCTNHRDIHRDGTQLTLEVIHGLAVGVNNQAMPNTPDTGTARSHLRINKLH